VDSKPTGGTTTGDGQQNQKDGGSNDSIEHCTVQTLQKSKGRLITIQDINLPYATLPRPQGMINEGDDPNRKLTS
jgi:hypothetical protein